MRPRMALVIMLAPSCTMQGRIFLDRSGTLFEEVLSLLRDGPEWRPPEDRCVSGGDQLWPCLCVGGGAGVEGSMQLMLGAGVGVVAWGGGHAVATAVRTHFRGVAHLPWLQPANVFFVFTV